MMRINEKSRLKFIKELKEIFDWNEKEEKRVRVEHPGLTGLDAGSKYIKPIHKEMYRKINEVKEQYKDINVGFVSFTDVWKYKEGEDMEYIIRRIMERAKEAAEESREDKDDAFKEGRNVAYYEVLDIIKSVLYVQDYDLKEYGLDIDLEKEFL